jgi:hypothetical protein
MVAVTQAWTLNPEAEPAPELAPSSQSLHSALQSLAAFDATAAGRAMVELLPLQGRVFHGPIRYDLLVSDGPWLAVSVDDGGTELVALDDPRPLDEVDARIECSLAELGEFVRERGGLLRRRTRLPMQGTNKRQALAALLSLTTLNLSLIR